MKYTWRIIIIATLVFANLIIFSNLDLEQYPILVLSLFIANVSLGWFIGYQLDKYVFSKKEFDSTQTTLIDYSHALESVPLGIGITNEKGQFEYVNKAHQELYGYNAEEFLRKSWTDCYSKDGNEQLYNEAIPLFNRNGKWRGETLGIKKDGSTFPQEIILSKIAGTPKTICVVRDISEQQQYIDYIKQVAEYNDLTHLPNRRKLLSDISKSKEELKDTSLLFIDLDRFKLVNDTLGHNYGDELLINVAQRLLTFQNEYLNVYHLGGDEFITLIHKGEQEYIENAVVEIITLLKEPYLIFGKEINLTTSIGVCRYPEHTDNHDDLIKLADTALYHAKSDGKNTYKFFSENIKLQLDRKAEIEIELRKVLQNGELYINYQPKFNLVSSRLVGFEALIRWRNPLLGMVSPAEFIPIAEETGLIVDIGKWVINQVLLQMSQWKTKGYSLVKISVNVSQKQFRDNDLVQYIESCLAFHKVDAQFFEVEITESLIADFMVIIPQLTAIKGKGIGISIDDFGTGYSSLNFINNLPIDTLKIDQSFVRGVLNNEKNSSLLKAMIDIGKTLKLDVVAEGIETEEHLNKLIELNCPLGQGYFFSKPIDALEIETIYFNKNETLS